MSVPGGEEAVGYHHREVISACDWESGRDGGENGGRMVDRRMNTKRLACLKIGPHMSGNEVEEGECHIS